MKSVRHVSNFSSEYTNEQILIFLDKFDWNWYVVSDRIGCDPDLLRSHFEQFLPKENQFGNDESFGYSHVRKEDIVKIQKITKDLLLDQIPLLLNSKITQEKIKEITDSILVEFGFTWILTNYPDGKPLLKSLEQEALTLAKWREQILYLNIIEETLFKILIQLQKNHPNRENSSFDLVELDSLELND